MTHTNKEDYKKVVINYWKAHLGEVWTARQSFTNYELDIIAGALENYNNKIHSKKIIEKTKRGIMDKIFLQTLKNYKKRVKVE